MVNRAKNESYIDGKHFLRSALTREQNVLVAQLELSSKSITHDGVKGDVNEKHFIDVLRKYLPMRYAVADGIVIDSDGATSHQIDIIIYDRQYTPTLLDQQDHRYIPAEAVYCILEVKPQISKGNLEYAGDKAKSVRDLHRTNFRIVSAQGESKPRPLFTIIAGLIAPQVVWKDGLLSELFMLKHSTMTGLRSLDCCLALSDRSFDVYDAETPVFSEKNCGLAFFLFRLLYKLNSLGTAPAVDWNKYAKVLGRND